MAGVDSAAGRYNCSAVRGGAKALEEVQDNLREISLQAPVRAHEVAQASFIPPEVTDAAGVDGYAVTDFMGLMIDLHVGEESQHLGALVIVQAARF